MHRTGALATAALLAVAAACADGGYSPTEPDAPEIESNPSPLRVGTPATEASDRFLHCPVSTTRSASRTVGLLGGTIAVDGHRITIPPAAVLIPTTFTVTVPASAYIEVEIHAEGQERFDFLLPATVTMSYERCGELGADPDDLEVWYINGLTGLLLELMGGTADPEARKITFQTGHLSGFIIAN